MDDENKTHGEDEAANEGDPKWREQTQETNEQAERLAPPSPSGSDAESTGP